MPEDTSNTPVAAAVTVSAPVAKEPVAKEPVAPAEPQTVVDIDDRDAQIATLKLQLEQMQLKAAVQSVQSGPSQPLGSAGQDIQRQQAIKAAGGLAYWNLIPVRSREIILGATENVTDAEVNKFFGKNSSFEAASLAKLNPSRYKTLKIAAKERNIL
jgi:hypothetical protein